MYSFRCEGNYLYDQSFKDFNVIPKNICTELGIRPSLGRLGPRKCSIILFPNMRHTEDNSANV